MKRTARSLHLAAALALMLPLAHAAQDDAVARIVKQTDTSRLLIVGEMHGTREVPALVAEVAAGIGKLKDAAGKAQPLVVALEMPAQDSGHQAYLASDGTAGDRKRLLASPFWAKAYQDGRASEAMLALIESVRKQARAGGAIKLAAFDMSEAQIAAKVDRDQAMADNLRVIVQDNPAARIVALAGNYHARQSVGAPWNAAHRFMAGYLTDLAPFSLHVNAPTGSYWACSGGDPASCEMNSFGKGVAPPADSRLHINAALKAMGYNQELELPKLTASLAARGANRR